MSIAAFAREMINTVAGLSPDLKQYRGWRRLSKTASLYFIRSRSLAAALFRETSDSQKRAPDSSLATSADAAWRYLRGQNLDSGDSCSKE